MRRIRYDLTWRRAQVAAMLAVWAAGATALGWRWADRPIQLGHSLPVMPQRVAAVTEKINPNTAPVGSLRRLSGIGPVKAQAIADYAAAHGRAAFRRPEDLAAVTGIGPGMVERLRPYLVFAEKDN
ncbi:MAG: helix-hairpin-helix domain-containing protein [Phycisphaerae bacterium]|nr:helix-hairpin-helix domain-containing protein [Phycisphaerae bacterium]